MTNGAVSPLGENHPGEILYEDKVLGKTYTKRADQVPVTMAWVDLDDEGYIAVAKVVITGLPERLRITKYSADGRMLETTVTAPPPPPPSEW